VSKNGYDDSLEKCELPASEGTTAAPKAATYAPLPNVTAGKVSVSVVVELHFESELSASELITAEEKSCKLAIDASDEKPDRCTLTAASRRRLLAGVVYELELTYVVDEADADKVFTADAANEFAEAVVASEDLKELNGGVALEKPAAPKISTVDSTGKKITPNTEAPKKDFSGTSTILVGAFAVLAMFL
jgi:hypothetical protein